MTYKARKIKPVAVVVHHSGTSDLAMDKAIQSFNNTHKSKGFPVSTTGYYVGYHEIIDAEGNFRKVREYDEEGAHCKANGRNFNSIGICMIGDFRGVSPTKAQLDTLVKRLKFHAERLKLKKGDITYHRKESLLDAKVGSTECPGVQVIAKFDEIVSRVFETQLELSEWQKEAVEFAKNFGFSNGERPLDTITRVEVMEMIRKYDLEKDRKKK